MRVNVAKALKAFEQGREYRGSESVSARVVADYPVLFSYGTPLLARVSERYVFNVSHYSVTTTTQQNAIRVWLAANVPAGDVIEVNGVPRGGSFLYLTDAVN